MNRDDLLSAMAEAEWARQYGDDTDPSGGGAFRRTQIRNDVEALVPAVVDFVASFVNERCRGESASDCGRLWAEDMGNRDD